MTSRMLGAVDRHNKTQNVDIWARQIATPEAHRAQNADQNIYILSLFCRSTAPSIREAILEPFWYRYQAVFQFSARLKLSSEKKSFQNHRGALDLAFKVRLVHGLSGGSWNGNTFINQYLLPQISSTPQIPYLIVGSAAVRKLYWRNDIMFAV